MVQGFGPARLRLFEATKYLRVRVGSEHRFIAIWVVVVSGRVFVRPWNDRPDGWRAAFGTEPRGAVLLDGREVPVRAVSARGAALMRDVSAAYAAKYTTKANAPYVVGLAEPRRVAATLELLPDATRRARPAPG